MQDLATAGPVSIDRLEEAMLAMPQAECPVSHHFGPGLYMRELRMKAGTLAIGHAQRFEHVNILLQGAVRMSNDDGSTFDRAAPRRFIGKPGRKMGQVLEDVVWINVYATSERDVDAIEREFLDKSQAWVAADTAHARQAAIDHAGDRADYLRLLDQTGFTHDVARAQSVSEADQMAMPDSGSNVRVMASPIEGLGVFLSTPIEPFHVIAPARVAGKRTPAGRYTNHAARPNAAMVLRLDGDIDLVAISRIEGCKGGQPGDEVTIDYRQALALSGVAADPKEFP